MRYRKRAMIVAPQPEADRGRRRHPEGGRQCGRRRRSPARWCRAWSIRMMCGIAGFGSCGIVHARRKEFHGYIDFHAPAPLAARPDMWADLIEREARDGYGFILRGRVNDIGYQSICAPASLGTTTRRTSEHGSLPWARIVEPAIALGRERLDGAAARALLVGGGRADGPRAEPRAHSASRRPSRALYCRPDGTPKRVGDRVVNRDLGQTLRADRQARRPTSSTRARSRTRSSRTCAGTTACSRSTDLAGVEAPCATRRSGATIAATASRPTSRRAAA